MPDFSFADHAAVIPPLVTPLREDRSLDLPSLGALVELVRGQGVDGVLVLGSTGEGAHLLLHEQVAVVEAAVAAAGSVPVMAGAAGTSTRHVVETAIRLADAGASAILAAPPLAFDLSDGELGRHYRAIRAAVDLPLIAYNVPSRVPTTISPSLLSDLADDGTLAGVKDSSGSLDSHAAYTAATSQVPSFTRMTGSETGLVDAADLGFAVFVPGLANVFAPLHVGVVDALRRGDLDAAVALERVLERAVSIYATPERAGGRTSRAIGALKHALVMRGVIASFQLTEPMIAQQESSAHVGSVLADVGV